MQRTVFSGKEERRGKVIVESERKSWEEFGVKLEKLGQTAGKPFWSAIKNLRNGGKREMSSVLNKDGKLTVDAEKALGKWQEYFEDY